MIAIRCFVISLCCSATIAGETKMPDRLIGLVKPGQAASIFNIQSAGKWDLRIYSKRKKLEILAEHQKRLRQQEAIKARAGDGRLPISRISSNSGIYDVHRVGQDFVALTRNRTELIVIPIGSIRQIKFEQTEEDIEEFGNSFEAFAMTENE